MFQDESDILDISRDLKASRGLAQSRSRSPILVSKKNLTESHQPIEVYFSKKKASNKQDELNLKDFALFNEDAEKTFSPKKLKKHCYHNPREDIIPDGGGSEEKPKSSNFNGLSSLSKIDLQN